MQSELKKARLAANLTINDVSEKLNIRKKYLIALEDDNLTALPGEVYKDGYLKMYAKFLKVDLSNNLKVNNATVNNEVKQVTNKKNSHFGAYLVILSLLTLLGIIVMYPLVI